MLPGFTLSLLAQAVVAAVAEAVEVLHRVMAAEVAVVVTAVLLVQLFMVGFQPLVLVLLARVVQAVVLAHKVVKVELLLIALL